MNCDHCRIIGQYLNKFGLNITVYLCGVCVCVYNCLCVQYVIMCNFWTGSGNDIMTLMELLASGMFNVIVQRMCTKFFNLKFHQTRISNWIQFAPKWSKTKTDIRQTINKEENRSVRHNDNNYKVGFLLKNNRHNLLYFT